MAPARASFKEVFTMASRTDLRVVESIVGRDACLRLVIVTSTNGAIATNGSAKSRGFTTIARTNTGEYTLTLADKWVDLSAYSLQLLVAGTSAASKGTVLKIKSMNLANRQIIIQAEFQNGTTPTLADITDGGTIYGWFVMDRGKV